MMLLETYIDHYGHRTGWHGNQGPSRGRRDSGGPRALYEHIPSEPLHLEPA